MFLNHRLQGRHTVYPNVYGLATPDDDKDTDLRFPGLGLHLNPKRSDSVVYVGSQHWINIHKLVIADPAELCKEFESRVGLTTNISPGSFLHSLQEDCLGSISASLEKFGGHTNRERFFRHRRHWPALPIAKQYNIGR